MSKKDISKPEKVVRSLLIDFCIPPNFNRNYRPDWLKNPKTGKNLELDFYIWDYNIAIEVQGRQHFHYTKQYSSDIDYQRYKDFVKYEICLDRDISILEIYMMDIPELKQHSFWKFKQIALKRLPQNKAQGLLNVMENNGKKRNETIKMMMPPSKRFTSCPDDIDIEEDTTLQEWSSLSF